jgi:hypothetical protein
MCGRDSQNPYDLRDLKIEAGRRITFQGILLLRVDNFGVIPYRVEHAGEAPLSRTVELRVTAPVAAGYGTVLM